MKRIAVDGGLFIKSWCGMPEEGALAQAKNLARLPFAFSHVCLMPDAHQGFGMPIGGVLATSGVIIPNAVGVDIGCGMCAVKTSVSEVNHEVLKTVLAAVRLAIPLGFAKHRRPQAESLMPAGGEDCPVVRREYGNALLSLGTLGGGNHFIEIQRDAEGFVWLMIHSGSRNLGKQVADFYNHKAIELNRKQSFRVPREWDLAHLPVDSGVGQAYMAEMRYCVDFALANRRLMMRRLMEIFHEAVGGRVDFAPLINIAHNYAALERHFGQDVWVHRKGATSARKGEVGIVPGSQGSSSYIVEGSGSTESFSSCAHGAGRKMGRRQAERSLNLEAEKRRLDERGIIHAIRGVRDLDEAAGAYKDIDQVMAEQSDLVSILTVLSPLAVVKG